MNSKTPFAVILVYLAITFAFGMAAIELSKVVFHTLGLPS
jgi:hypothetical protein